LSPGRFSAPGECEMTDLHLYDGPFTEGAAIYYRARREAMGERLQDRLDREYLYTAMSESEYDERCAEIKQFVEDDTPGINSAAFISLAMQGLD